MHLQFDFFWFLYQIRFEQERVRSCGPLPIQHALHSVRIVAPMSFAQELAAASMSVQEKWFQEVVQKFMAECKAEANKGYCSCRMVHERPQYLSDESLEILAQRLHELGLVDACASFTWVEQPVGRLCSYKNMIELTAGWKLKHAEPEKTGKGTSSTCPVCLGNGPVVALMPCGHVVCKQCQASQKFRQCPICRQGVSGATNGLFLWNMWPQNAPQWLAWKVWRILFLAFWQQLCSQMDLDAITVPFGFAESTVITVASIPNWHVHWAGRDSFWEVHDVRMLSHVDLVPWACSQEHATYRFILKPRSGKQETKMANFARETGSRHRWLQFFFRSKHMANFFLCFEELIPKHSVVQSVHPKSGWRKREHVNQTFNHTICHYA